MSQSWTLLDVVLYNKLSKINKHAVEWILKTKVWLSKQMSQSWTLRDAVLYNKLSKIKRHAVEWIMKTKVWLPEQMF